ALLLGQHLVEGHELLECDRIHLRSSGELAGSLLGLAVGSLASIRGPTLLAGGGSLERQTGRSLRNPPSLRAHRRVLPPASGDVGPLRLVALRSAPRRSARKAEGIATASTRLSF